MSIGLRKVERKHDPDVVVFLEEVLERAKAGEVTGVLILAQDRDGVAYSIVGIKDRYKVSGFLYHALHKLQADVADS